MIFIDSNVWCFYFDTSFKENKKITDAVNSLVDKERVLSNTLIVMEVSHFLVKNLGQRIGKINIDKFLSLPIEIIDVDFSLMKNSIDMLSDYSHTGIGGRDATILATLKQEKTDKIMTNDSAFKKIEWLNVIDPLE